MKKKKNRKTRKKFVYGILLGSLVVLSVVFFFLLKGSGRCLELEGEWQYDTHTSYVFDKSGRGYIQLDNVQLKYKYSVEDNRLNLNFEDANVEDCVYEFEIRGDELQLVGKEGTTGGNYQLQRKK